MNRETKFKAEERFPITGQGFTLENCWMGLIVEFC